MSVLRPLIRAGVFLGAGLVAYVFIRAVSSVPKLSVLKVFTQSSLWVWWYSMVQHTPMLKSLQPSVIIDVCWSDESITQGPLIAPK